MYENKNKIKVSKDCYTAESYNRQAASEKGCEDYSFGISDRPKIDWGPVTFGAKPTCFDDEVKSYCPPNERHIVDGLAFVGIISDRFISSPSLVPHNRDFSNLDHLGDFTYLGDTVDKWYFPTMGAEKYPRSALERVSVVAHNGILTGGQMTVTVIDAAREKLDGEEVIVYGVETRQGKFYFRWGAGIHARVVANGVGHYEQVGDKLYWLSGHNSLEGIEHTWEYLTGELVKSCTEGLIVRRDGIEHRVRKYKNATFRVSKGYACDLNNEIKILCDVPDGLYDFKYYKNNWVLEKERKDKARPDSYGGIRHMLESSIDLEEFVAKVPMGKTSRMFIPLYNRVVPLVGNDDERKQILGIDGHNVFIRGASISPNTARSFIVKLKDSYYLDHWKIRHVSRSIHRQQIMVYEPNTIISSGQCTIIPYHSSIVKVKYKEDDYSSDLRITEGRAVYVYLDGSKDKSIICNGRCAYRVYKVKKS